MPNRDPKAGVLRHWIKDAVTHAFETHCPGAAARLDRYKHERNMRRLAYILRDEPTFSDRWKDTTIMYYTRTDVGRHIIAEMMIKPMREWPAIAKKYRTSFERLLDEDQPY